MCAQVRRVVGLGVSLVNALGAVERDSRAVHRWSTTSRVSKRDGQAVADGATAVRDLSLNPWTNSAGDVRFGVGM